MHRLDAYLAELAAALTATPREPLDEIAWALWETYRRDGTIIACGNGGSAASASHLACDLSKWTIHEGHRRVRAIALTDNVPIMTAWSNDTAYERAFVEQLMGLYRPATPSSPSPAAVTRPTCCALSSGPTSRARPPSA